MSDNTGFYRYSIAIRRSTATNVERRLDDQWQLEAQRQLVAQQQLAASTATATATHKVRFRLLNPPDS